MGIYDTHVPEAGNGLYLRLKDGETVKLRIASDPAIYTSKSERDGKEVFSTRYAWIVWNQDKESPQILQQSGTFFKNIAALAQDDEWGEPTGYDVKVTRHGAGFNDTTYTIVPAANREPLSSSAQKAIKEIDLIEKIQASPFAQQVLWLAEFDKQQNNQAEDAVSEPLPLSKKPVKKEKKDTVITGFDDNEPIDLDDIPF